MSTARGPAERAIEQGWKGSVSDAHASRLSSGFRLKTDIQFVSFSSSELVPLRLEARIRSVQCGRPLLGALVGLFLRADKLAVAAVEDQPTTRLDLLGDEPLTAKRHRGDLGLLFEVGVSILGPSRDGWQSLMPDVCNQASPRPGAVPLGDTVSLISKMK